MYDKMSTMQQCNNAKTKYDKIPTMHNAGVIIVNNAKFEYDKCQQCRNGV